MGLYNQTKPIIVKKIHEDQTLHSIKTLNALLWSNWKWENRELLKSNFTSKEAIESIFYTVWYRECHVNGVNYVINLGYLISKTYRTYLRMDNKHNKNLYIEDKICGISDKLVNKLEYIMKGDYTKRLTEKEIKGLKQTILEAGITEYA